MPELAAHGAWIVFAATLASRLGLPVPAAPFVVVAGALHAGAGQALALGATLAAAVAGNLLGDGAWFLAGRRHGYRILRLLCRISISPDSCVSQSETFIARWGGASLLAAKFVPGISVVAPPMAGALGMSLAGFVGWEALGAGLWTLVFLGLGALFAPQVNAVLAALATLGLAAVAVLALAGALWLALRWWRRYSFLRSVAMSRISVAELRGLFDDGAAPVVIDVRSPTGREMDPRRIPGALAIELERIAQAHAGLPRDREIVLYCNCPNEVAAASAARALAERGLTRVRPLAGGLDAWVAAGYDVEHEVPAAEADRLAA